MSHGPFFSVLVSTYNREHHIRRCLMSVLDQTFTDFEVVVVDDGSTDGTRAALDALAQPRLRVVSHERNRGISPARATAVDHARGEWLVIVDSDWELYPHTLARLREIIAERPESICIIRSRLQCDDGTIQPEVMPPTVTGYRERLRWMEALARQDAGSDAGHCIHRSVFASRNYYANRRGAMELLWETDLARSERSLWARDILGVQHTDAPNSHSRDRDFGRVINRLRSEARDDLWMAETMLAEHGCALERYAPSVRRSLMERSTVQALLAGERRRAIRTALAASRAGGSRRMLCTTLALGAVSPSLLAYAKIAARRRRSARAAASTRRTR